MKPGDAGGGSAPGLEPGTREARTPSREWRGEMRPVDARRAPEGGAAPERTLAEWYGEGRVEPGAAGAAGGGGAAAMREAAAAAERAVEQQQVHPRYRDLVRRVFRRYSEGAGGGARP